MKAALLAAGMAVLASCAPRTASDEQAARAAAARVAACMGWPKEVAKAIGNSFSEGNRGSHYFFYPHDATIVVVHPGGECYGFRSATLGSWQLPDTYGIGVAGLDYLVARTRVETDGSQTFIVTHARIEIVGGGEHRVA